MDNELRKALKPVKRRLRLNRFLRGAAAGLAAGLGAAAMLQAVSFFVPVPDRGLWAAAAAAAVTVSAALGNALRPVRDREAAGAADACGLQERAVTALEFEHDGSPVSLLQRRDACAALERLDVKQMRPGSVKKALFTALGCTALLAGLLLVPSPQDPEAAARKALTRTIREGREAIVRAEEEDEEALPEEKRSELRKITADLTRDLGESRDAADALVALDRAEQRLEQLRQQTAGDAEAAANAEAGADAAAESGENTPADASAQQQTGQPGAANAGTAPTAAQLKTLQALASLKSFVNPSAIMTGNSAAAGTGEQGRQAGQGHQGSSGASGQNTGNKTGPGAGEGSTNEEQTGNGQHSSAPVKGSRNPSLKEEQYETIYDPEHIDKARQDAATEQERLSDEDARQLETGPGRGNLTGDVPWSEALQDYADTEARSADRENLTVQERQWVDSYFRILTEQK